jgi:hypothetical protein
MLGLEGKGACYSFAATKKETCYSFAATKKEMENLVMGNYEGIQLINGLDLIGMIDVEKSQINFLPSYREVLTRTQLPIYAGGELLTNLDENIGKEGGCRD